MGTNYVSALYRVNATGACLNATTCDSGVAAVLESAVMSALGITDGSTVDVSCVTSNQPASLELGFPTPRSVATLLVRCWPCGALRTAVFVSRERCGHKWHQSSNFSVHVTCLPKRPGCIKAVALLLLSNI